MYIPSTSVSSLFVLASLLGKAAAETLLYSYSGVISAGNYSYLELWHRDNVQLRHRGRNGKWRDIFSAPYRITKEAQFSLVLTTGKGDADVYVNWNTKDTGNHDPAGNLPTYSNYKAQSTTCGEDAVVLTPETDAPFWIGIYGHPFHDISQYVCTLYVVLSSSNRYESYVSSYDSYKDGGAQQARSAPSPKPSSLNTNKDGEESVLWTIFVGLLKILLDILV